MAIATNINRTRDYVLHEDRDEPAATRTVFRLRTLSAAARGLINDRMVGGEASNASNPELDEPGSAMNVAVEYGVAGWKNLRDDEGGHVEPSFVRGPSTGRQGRREQLLSTDSLNAIAPYIPELFNAVMEFNGLGEDVVDDDQDADQDGGDDQVRTEAGNLQSPPDSPPDASTGRTEPAAAS